MSSVRFKFIFLFLVFGFLLSSASAFDMVDTSDGVRKEPILYYDFDDGDFPTDDVLDKSTSSNDGTAFGVVNGSGVLGNGGVFDGDNDYVNVTDADVFGTELSVCAWFNYTENPDNGMIVSWYEVSANSPNGQFGIYDSNGGYLRWWARDAAAASTAGLYNADDLRNTGWHHACGVISDTNSYLYVDGSLVNSTVRVGSGSFGTGVDIITVGRGSTGYIDYFNGSIDEVRIYNFSLSEQQVVGLYAVGSSELVVNRPESVVYENASTVPLNVSFNIGVVRNISIGNVSYIDDDTVLFLDFEEHKQIEAPVDPYYFKAQYRFSDSAVDVSGNGFNPVTSSLTYVDGKFGKGVDISPSGYIRIDSMKTDADIQVNDSFVVSAWIYSLRNDTSEIFENYKSSNDENTFGLGVLNNSGSFYVRAYTQNSSGVGFFTPFTDDANVTIFNGEWTHIAMRISHSRHDVCTYLNGERGQCKDIPAVSQFGPRNDQAKWIGRNLNRSSPNWFNGTIDEVLVVPGDLSDEDVYNLYEGGVADHGIYENDGFIVGALNTTGKYGSGMKFDGVDDYVEFTSVDLDDTYAISFWAFLNYSVGADYMFSTYDGVHTNNWTRSQVGTTSDAFLCAFRNNTDTVNLYRSGVFYDEWFHMVCVRDGNDVYMYFNGELVDYDNVYGLTDGGLTMDVGGLHYSASGTINGTLDDVIVSKRALSSSEIHSDYLTGLIRHNDTYWTLNGTLDVDDYGILYYDFEDLIYANGTVSDPSDSRNIGFYYNTTNVSGKYGQGMYFDATYSPATKFIRVPSLDTKDFSGGFTVMGWINTITLATNQQLFTKMHDLSTTISAGNASFLVGIDSATGIIKVNLYHTGSSANYTQISYSSISIDTWYHVAAVYNPSDGNVSFYINGAIINYSSVYDTCGSCNVVADIDAPFMIGARMDSGDGFPRIGFNGTMDDVRVFDRALTTDEIQAVYDHRSVMYGKSVNLSTTVVNTAGFATSDFVMFDIGDPNSVDVSFVTPTPEDGNISTVAINHTINVSIDTVGNLSQFNFTFNGTNNVLYNDSLLLFLDFDEYNGTNNGSLYYTFENGPYPANDVHDASGNGNDGVVSLAVNTTGKFDQGLEFIGANDGSLSNTYVTVDTDGSFSGDLCNNGCTMCAWVYPYGGAFNSVIFGKFNAAPDRFFYLAIEPDNEILTQTSVDGGTNVVTFRSDTSVVTFNEWNHLCLKIDATTSSVGQIGLYHNGINVGNRSSVVAVDSSIWASSTEDFFIGTADSDSPDIVFNGTMDDVIIYKEVLTDNQITSLYNTRVSTYQATVGRSSTEKVAVISGAVNSTGKYGGGMQFSENGQFINVSGVLTYSSAPFNTWSMWVKSYTNYVSNNVSYLFDTRGDIAGFATYAFGRPDLAYNNGIRFFAQNATPSNFDMQTSNVLTEGEWAHLVFTQSDSSMKLYVNGVLVNSTSYNGLSRTGLGNDNLFGALSTTYSGSINGTLDELYYYDRELSVDESMVLYTSSLDKFNDSLWTFTSYQNDLSNGNYTYQAFASDSLDYSSETDQQWFLLDVDSINPAIEFVTPSDSTGTVSRQFILANVSVVDENFANVTIYLYNSSGSLENSTFSTSNISYVNISGLSDGLYRLNATAYDVIGNSNSTGTENITISTDYLNVSFVTPTPEDGNISTVAINYTINVSIDTVGNLSQFNFTFNGTNTVLYNDSLVVMYNFEDGNYPTNNVIDLSISNNDGIVTGATNNTGKYGSGLYFDGNSQVVTITDDGSFSGICDNGCTWSTWLNHTLVDGDNHWVITRFDTNNPNREIFMSVRSDIDLFRCAMYNGSSSTPVLGLYYVPVGGWQQFTCMYDGGIGKEGHVYACVDGVCNSSTTTMAIQPSSAWHNTKDIILGGYSNDDGSTFGKLYNGSLDNVRIFSRNLSFYEINGLYKSNLDKFNDSLWTFTSYQNELDNGNYTYQVFASDSLGYSNESDSQWFSIETIPTVVMNSPNNLTLTNVSEQTFSCNITGASVDFMNITIWNSTDDVIVYNKTTLGNSTAVVSWANTFIYDDTYKWACYVDVGGTKYWGDGNWTIELDTVAPTLDYAANSTSAGLGSNNYIFVSMSAVDANLDTVSISLYNTSGLVSQINSTWYNFTSLQYVNYTTNVTANDSLGQINTTSRVYQLVSDIPFINITVPENNTETTVSLTTFNATVSKNVTSCILRLNESNGYPAAFRVNVTGTADSAYNVYLHLNSSISPSFNWTRNCTDLDVRNINGTRLDYWVQSCYSGNESGSFWVETDQAVTSGGYIIDVSYNNDTYADLSSGEATFPLFDDFDGAVVNTTLWDYMIPSSLGDPLTDDGYLNLSAYSYRGLRGIRSKEQFGRGYDFHLIDKPSGGNFGLCASAFVGFITSTGDIYEHTYNTDQHVGFGENIDVAEWTIATDSYNSSRNTSTTPVSWASEINEFVVRYDATSKYGYMSSGTNYTYSSSVQIPDVNMDAFVIVHFVSTCASTPELLADTVFVATGASTIPTVSYEDEYGFVNMDVTNDDENTIAGVSTNLPDGVLDFNVTCTDSSGVYNTSLNYQITVDTTDPVIAFVEPIVDDYIQDWWFELNVTVVDDNYNYLSVIVYNASDNVQFDQRSGPVTEIYANISAQWEGIYWVNATANDSLGNIGYGYFKNITVDLTDPVPEYAEPSDDAGELVRDYIIINVSAGDINAANVTVRLYNASFDIINSTTIAGNATYMRTDGLVLDTTYHVNATAVDLAGRVGYLVTREFNLTSVPGGDNVSFTITKPTTGCFENWGCSTPGCSACIYPFFNNSKYVNYNVSPFGQNETVPFWVVNNTGDTALNVTVQLNQTGHSQIKLKVMTVYEDNEHVCSNTSEPSGGCMYVMDTSVHMVVSNLSIGNVTNVWLFTDFVGVSGGTSVNRNISINTTQFTS